ncbi:hypothetical protein Pstr01_03150 [Pseudomonas straminea]|uniref:Uncharacterized protein n=1 Tax=Pseudomonas straminea TaxID=47882 RepID=A0A1I1S6K5_PSEOC|nr:hypothetical protein [Pseudomonas straminea]GLX12076.1 hypothetical protein Pstr01_03150 [Pseudomonas straminea]SFD38600.1 hypothetical protein SAMN05216372_101517 [Pseudomonas straminea]
MVNPYAINPAEPGASHEARQGSQLPMRLLFTALACCTASIVIRWVIMWLTLEPEYFQTYLNNLWQLGGYWLSALAVDGCSALLLARYYLQRHSLVDVSRPALLVALFVGLYLIAIFVVGLLYNLLWAQLAPSLYENASGLSPTLLMLPLNLVSFMLATLLPLWLSLYLMRRAGQFQSGLTQVSRGEAALAFGLLFIVFYTKLLTLLPTHMISPYGMEWLLGLSNVVGLVYGLVAMIAAYRSLPAQLARLAVGRLLASVLLCMAIWLLVAAVLAFVLLVALYAGSEFLVLGLMVLFGILLLAMLWPLTHLSLRWVYRPLAA